MILKAAHIKNFRSARDVQVSFEKQTAILGANGAGKSTILKAIDRFYGSSTQVSLDDFFGRNVDEPIEIALTFANFSPEETALFRSRIFQGDMTVVRVFEAKGGRDSGKYFGLTSGHAPFQAIRRAESATAQKSQYSALKIANEALYETLEPIRRADEIEGQLLAWERSHPELCEQVRDDGQFLGFTNVGNGSLKKSTSFVFIPAVRDAGPDALDGRGSAIAKLMELVVRNAIQKRAEIQEWQEGVSAKYRELTDPDNLTELGDLAEALTNTLKTLYDETSVSLTWKPSPDFEIPMPTALVALQDAGYQAPVELQGNGLQRAFILTLLQHLAMAAILQENVTDEPIHGSGVVTTLTANVPTIPIIPALILAIEEPELYQHPTKQRHFAKVLSLLSEGTLPGVVTKTQVIFASHSPYFVSMDRFSQVRLARRSANQDNGAKECILRESHLAEVLQMLERSRQIAPGTWTIESLLSRLHIVTPELSEGFFADVVLLVEGESDKAALRAAASTKKIDLEALGVAVLQAGGKNNLDRPAAIFKALKIPVYVVWDCDRKPSTIEDEASNRALQRLLGVDEANIEAAISRLTDSYACFEGTLESTLIKEFGEAQYSTAIASALNQFGLREKKDAIKAAPVMHHVLSTLEAVGLRSNTLDGIIERTIAMRERRVDNALVATATIT
jgi:putative ATP-dependent endonuclease of OLD family